MTVTADIPTDLVTPLGAYLRLRARPDARGAFLLELRAVIAAVGVIQRGRARRQHGALDAAKMRGEHQAGRAVHVYPMCHFAFARREGV